MTDFGQCSGCGMRFRSAIAEARHRHNFPALCRQKKPAPAQERNAADYAAFQEVYDAAWALVQAIIKARQRGLWVRLDRYGVYLTGEVRRDFKRGESRAVGRFEFSDKPD